MDVVIVIMLAANFAATLWHITRPAPTSKVEFLPVQIVEVSAEVINDDSAATPEPTTKVQAPQPSTQAWNNRKGIPWNEINRPVEPPAPKPEGYGWVR